MGATLYADNKMQYYPTNPIITMQTLSILSNYARLDDKELRDKFLKEIYQKEQYKNIRSTNFFTKRICENIELHNKIKFEIYGKVVADLFAGEGEWIKLFKTRCEKHGNILIANEIEENRYNTMCEDNIIDYTYNSAFEDLQLPKKCIDIMLFNPPYGNTNGIRNAKVYLKMLLERDLMAKSSAIVMVLNERDLKECNDLIVRNFERLILYKAFDEEFEKFGQFICIGLLKDDPITEINLANIKKYNSEKEGFLKLIDYIKDNNIQFDYSNIFNYCYKISSSAENIREIFNNFEYIKKNVNKISNIDKAWKWVMNNTQINDLSEKVIEVPKKLKKGEIANVIASGKINGEIGLENGIGKHIVVGGVKTIENQNKIKTKNKKGETEEKLITLKQSIPFVNILINNKGNVEIKELKNGSE